MSVSPREVRAMSVRLATRVKRARQAFVVADHDQRRIGRREVREQQIEEGLLPVAVERGCGLVGDHKLGRADERAGGGHALLLARRSGSRRKLR